MFNLFSKGSFFLTITCAFLSLGCGNEHPNEGDSTSYVIDEQKNIRLTAPDSLASEDLENARKNLEQYFGNAKKFYIDTISTVSLASIQLEVNALQLQRKLLKALPKFSISTGSGEDKFTSNYYIVEGDVKVDRDELYYYCLNRLQKKHEDIAGKIKSQKLTLATDINGNASIWPVGVTIKYCVMRSSFSSKANYDSTVKNMQIATVDWMNCCNVKFKYVKELDVQDIDLEAYPNQILFVVRQFNANGSFIAQSFFPSDPIFKRMLLLDNSFFTSIYNKSGVLRHELGHILGFRHEHIWSSDVSCAGENIIEGELGAKPITPYDPYSVMHYPCGLNIDNHILGLTKFDIAGASKIYPFK